MSERSNVVDDQLDVPLEDDELLDEVEMTTNLMIAASQSEDRLDQDQVDRILGVAAPQIPGQPSRPAGE